MSVGDPIHHGISPSAVGTAMVGVVAQAANIFESAANRDYASVIAGAGALEDEVARWIAAHVPPGADPPTDKWLRERGLR